MASWKRILPCLLAVALACPLWATGQDSKPAAEPADKPAEKPADKPEAAAPAPPSAEEIAALAKQLDADKYADRQAASDKLVQIGKPAIEALTGAATGDSLEATVRAIDILKKHLDSTDAATKDAARQAMEKIAKSDHAAAAPRAKDVLKALEEKERQPQPGQVFGGGVQIAIAGGGARRMSVRNVNGVKTIEVDEGNQKTKIEESPDQGIKMEVTSKKDNGKETTEKYEAKNAEELKKKDAKAYEIYAKYAKAGGVANVQFGVANAAVARAAQVNSVDTAARILPAWISHLDRLAGEEQVKQASKQSNEELKKKVGEAREQLEKLEKRLQEAIDKADAEAKQKAAETPKPAAQDTPAQN